MGSRLEVNIHGYLIVLPFLGFGRNIRGYLCATRIPLPRATIKYDPYGGPLAAFIPEANIRVGALILKACIAKAGSLEAGLKNYLGAPNAASGINTYTGKVFSEREELRSIARRFSNNV